MERMETVRAIVFGIIALLCFYKSIYTVLGVLIKPRVFPKAPQTKRYGIIVAARNEEKVIGHLVDSLLRQTYPGELYRVFVVADNCTDRTAEIAQERGATVYVRHCPEKARKGWALEYLFDCIERDYGIKSFDGYLFFDADNVVSADYLEQMNNAFATGADGVIGYRNTKNFDRNAISAHYGIHFMRSTVTLHRARSGLGMSTHIAGTGYLLSSELLKDGWHYSCLTEDTQATMDFVVKGKRIEYCEAAEFYDEQPYQIKVMVRQRIRWAKGRLACFFGYGYKLLGGMVKQRHCGSDTYEYKAEKPTGVIPRISHFFTRLCSGIAKRLKGHGKRFSCYDMFFYLFPNSFFNKMTSIAFQISAVVIGVRLGEWVGAGADKWVLTALKILIGTLAGYVGSILLGLLVVIRERRHIRCSNARLALYLLSFPLFDILYAYLCLVSLFMRVKWKPIKHDEAISIDELQ